MKKHTCGENYLSLLNYRMPRPNTSSRRPILLLVRTSPGSRIVFYCDFAEDLTSKKRYTEASQVLLDYAKDFREAVIALVQGSRFSEARRIVRVTTSHLFVTITQREFSR